MVTKTRKKAVKKVVKKTDLELTKTESHLEALFALQLENAKVPPFIREFKFLKTRKYRFDFYNQQYKVAVEVHGGQWLKFGKHNSGAGLNSDCEKAALAILEGITVFQITGDQVKNGKGITWIQKYFTKTLTTT